MFIPPEGARQFEFDLALQDNLNYPTKNECVAAIKELGFVWVEATDIPMPICRTHKYGYKVIDDGRKAVQYFIKFGAVCRCGGHIIE